MYLPTHDLIYVSDICHWRYVSKITDVDFFYFDTKEIPNRVAPNDLHYGIVSRRYNTTPAVYRIYDNEGELVYIGESVKVYQRLKQHLANSGQYSKIRERREDISKIAISFFPIEGKGDIKDIETKLQKILIHSIEQYFILKYKPKYNGTVPTKDLYVKARGINSLKLANTYPKISSKELAKVFKGKTRNEIRTILTFLEDYLQIPSTV